MKELVLALGDGSGERVDTFTGEFRSRSLSSIAFHTIENTDTAVKRQNGRKKKRDLGDMRKRTDVVEKKVKRFEEKLERQERYTPIVIK